jgi:hypothetical protein
MGRIQHPLLPTMALSPYVFHPTPTPYLPLFIVPFQLLALVPPVPAAYVWEVVNFLGTIAYLWFFSRKTLSPRAVILMMVSREVFESIHGPRIRCVSAGESGHIADDDFSQVLTAACCSPQCGSDCRRS